MRKVYLNYTLALILVVCLLCPLVSCGPGGNGDEAPTAVATTVATTTTAATTTIATTSTTTTTQPAAATPAVLSLGASQLQVLSNDNDSSIITATVLDSDYAVIEGVWVAFSATGGKISVSSLQTDANGEAKTTFTSGTDDPTNRTVTITATVVGVAPETIPIQIYGSYLQLTAEQPPTITEGNSSILTITARNAAGQAVYGTLITVSDAGTGNVTPVPSSGNTNVQGKLQVTLTTAAGDAGNVTVTASGLGTTAQQAYTVVAPLQTFFYISDPTQDPAGYIIGGAALTVEITTPPCPGGCATHEVEFATTLGTLDGIGQVVTQNVSFVPGPDGTASVDFTSTEAGVATVQATEIIDSVRGATDSVRVQVAASAADAARITLQPMVSDVGLNGETTELIATVKTADDDVVGGALVLFTMENGTGGGGESISPVSVVTDVTGRATTTFTSGTLCSAAEGVTVIATVVQDPEGIVSVSSNQISFAGDLLVGPLNTIEFVNNDVTMTGTLSFNDTNPDTITRSSGSFINDGFVAGSQIEVSWSALNDGIFTIDAGGVSSSTLTLVPADTLADDPLDYATITSLGPDFITRSDGGDFTADGLIALSQIRVSGSVFNDGVYTMNIVTPDTIVLPATVSLTDEGPGASVSIVQLTGAPRDITRGDGNFDFFEAGEQIRVSGSALNDRVWVVQSLPAANILRLEPTEPLIDEAAGANVTITAISTSAQVVIGGTAGSVMIGTGTVISTLDPATYKLPCAVLVADSAGKAVPNAVVSLTVWPIKYSTGYWYYCPVQDCYLPAITGTYDNEDFDEDMVLDPGEDVGSDPGHGDGELTPHNSAAGTLPAEPVVTDEYGVATFDLVFIKDSAVWIVDRITATTFVLGTETYSSTTFRLPYEELEGCAGYLHDSPYNLY